MNFALFLTMRARGAPDALALVDPRLRLSWAELDSLVDRCANALVQRGLKRGDRLAIYLPNRAEVVIALLAAMKSGIVAAPLNWRLQGPDLDRVVGHCAPGALLTTAERRGDFPGLADKVLTVDATPRGGSFWDALAGAGASFAMIGCQHGDVANLLYTSGTTSTPKAAIHTHGMRVAVAAAMADCFALSSRDVGLAISPLFHTSGLSVFSNCIFAGCTLVLLERWDLPELLAAIETEKVTFLHLIGTIVVDIARAPASVFTRDTSTMRFTWGGGHSLDAQTLTAFEERIGGVFLQGYSRTEGGLAYNPLPRAERRFDANGYGNRNSSDLVIMDPVRQQVVAPGTIGEIVVRGDGVSPAYWDGEFLRVRPTYEGGWQPTGDLGFVDETGSLHFIGRSDHMIKTGGENVYPSEVETVLQSMPGIADAVVLGLPDARLGQRVSALVVRKAPTVTAAEIDAWCRKALGAFKIPRTIEFVDELPKLGTQKVDLAACRELLTRRTAKA